MTVKIVLLILAFNTTVSLVIFALTLRKNRQTALVRLTMSLFVPAFGPLMCLITAIPFRRGRYAMHTEERIRLLQIEKVDYVDNESLMSTVPVNDALTLSDENDRRGYLLGLLRHHDMASLRKILHKAVYNEDSEASHYAASAIMELQRVSYNNMEQAARVYLSEQPCGYTNSINYAVSILTYLENSEIGQMENYTFRQRYEEVMRGVFENHADECSSSDYENMVGFFMKQGRFDEARQYSEAYLEAFPQSENCYLLMLQVAYHQGDAGRFSDVFDQMRHSGLMLSSKGLDTVRFWMQPSVKGGLQWAQNSV